MPKRTKQAPSTKEIIRSTRSELTEKEVEYLIYPLIRSMHILTNENEILCQRVRELETDLEMTQSVIRDLQVTIAHPDMGSNHQAKTQRPRLSPEQWDAVARAEEKSDE